ncbi:glycosyltransferase (plasmid) [Cupriavidus necator]|nr:glycosyltransferase [Cupriavidus necator]
MEWEALCEKLLRQLTALPNFDRLISSVVVVDNGSADGSAEYIASNFPRVKLLALTENLGYAKGNNLGLKMCQAEFVLLLNNDTEINDANFISKLTDYAAANPACGAISPALYLPSGRLQTGRVGSIEAWLVMHLISYLWHEYFLSFRSHFILIKTCSLGKAIPST